MTDKKGSSIRMHTQQGTSNRKQFRFSTHILALSMPQYHISHQSLQIADVKVANSGSLSLPRVINTRSPKPIGASFMLGASNAQAN